MLFMEMYYTILTKRVISWCQYLDIFFAVDDDHRFRDIEMTPTTSTAAAPFHKGPPPASDDPDVGYGKPTTSHAPTLHHITPAPAPYRPAPDPQAYRPAPDPQVIRPPVDDDVVNKGYASESWA